MQDARLTRAFEAGLIDYVEANFPITPGYPPRVGGDAPVFVHCPVNGIASPLGVNQRLAGQVREAAVLYDSPWVGEHLCWTGPEAEGRLGYIATPLLCEPFRDIAVHNTRRLAEFYDRPVALELAPVYQLTGSYESEIHFLDSVAREADALIILDVAHWTASNRNLGREPDYGLDALDASRIVELHVAGIRAGSGGDVWHDSHDRVPEDAIMDLTEHLLDDLPALRAVTFEHAHDGPEQELVDTLERLRRFVGQA